MCIPGRSFKGEPSNSTGGKSSPKVDNPWPTCPTPFAMVLATGKIRSVTFFPRIFFPKTYKSKNLSNCKAIYVFPNNRIMFQKLFGGRKLKTLGGKENY